MDEIFWKEIEQAKAQSTELITFSMAANSKL